MCVSDFTDNALPFGHVIVHRDYHIYALIFQGFTLWLRGGYNSFSFICSRLEVLIAASL